MSDAFVSSEKRDQMTRRMAELEILEEDLTEKFILGSGKGGQKINKTASCVYIKHEPTGREVKCQKSRSRDLNRYYARKELCDAIEEEKLGEQSRRQQAMEKIRRQKRRRSRRAKQVMLESKHHQSSKKQLRGPVGNE